MRMNGQNTALANDLRAIVQSRTGTIDDGESVAMVLLWSFLMDHARCHDMDVEQLAAEQLQAFTLWARDNMRIEKTQ